MFLDAYIEHTFYVARTPFFVKFFSVATELGGGFLVAALSIALAVFWFRQNRLPYIVGLFVSVVGSGVVAQIIKYLVERPRPLMPAIVETGYSFPSGHTTAAFATATAMTLSYKKWYVAVPSYLYAGFVGYSRMRLGVHYPSDVFGGMVIGIGAGFLTWKLDQIIFKK